MAPKPKIDLGLDHSFFLKTAKNEFGGRFFHFYTKVRIFAFFCVFSCFRHFANLHFLQNLRFFAFFAFFCVFCVFRVLLISIETPIRVKTR